MFIVTELIPTFVCLAGSVVDEDVKQPLLLVIGSVLAVIGLWVPETGQVLLGIGLELLAIGLCLFGAGLWLLETKLCWLPGMGLGLLDMGL